jgi:acetyl esterase/lipase
VGGITVVLFKIILALFVPFALTVMAILSSSSLVSHITRKMFERPFQTKPEGYDTFLSRVKVRKNLSYQESSGEAGFDAYSPDEPGERIYPAILWVHGGGFVGGDKRDVENFAVMLAKEGYVVLAMNYDRAPEMHYPSQLIQIGEFYQHVVHHLQGFPIDKERIFFAGDSAGAQMVTNFLAIQYDKDLSRRTGVAQVVDLKDVRGVLLFCGLYDIDRFKDMFDMELFRITVSQIARSYFADKDWKRSPEYRDSSVMSHLSKDFPRTFITDGNHHSFQNQGWILADHLEEEGVYVDRLFFTGEAKVIHEYQFRLDTWEANQALQRAIRFLQKA